MKRRYARTLLLLALLLAISPALAALAQRVVLPAPKRAKLPQFNESDSAGVFFADVFSRLQGERPENPGRLAPAVAPQVASSSSGEQAAGGAFPWSQLISAPTIEDEVKAIKLQLDQDITTPGKFNSGDYQACRRHFSVLAMLFRIVSEFDGDVRWSDDAAAARDGFARVAANCKVGTQQVYNEARLRKQDLEDMVNGARLSAEGGSDDADWSATVDRSPLMQRLEIAFNQRIVPQTSSKSEFSANADKIRHEAELTAAIADVITREGMEDGGDDTYDGLADRMKAAARQIVEAIKLDNHQQAQEAVGEIHKACAECHENYRA